MLWNAMSRSAQEVPAPRGMCSLIPLIGDLDGDGSSELAVAYNTRKENGDDFDDIPRALIIYKKAAAGLGKLATVAPGFVQQSRWRDDGRPV